MVRCPGQDQQFWKPEDIFLCRCPNCGHELEFWKDDPFLVCKKCSNQITNPRLDLGCAKWCKHGPECLDYLSKSKKA
jgi:hypothetical protein